MQKKTLIDPKVDLWLKLQLPSNGWANLINQIFHQINNAPELMFIIIRDYQGYHLDQGRSKNH